ncbi:parathyroid hormone-like hormone b [Engraulis encrasicolus]|uniref:parathyroid hormone-like hormone b n=1 Tax=Engraulis encrasicolus TaxID=184585 RepID=UPI002FCFA5A2
MLLSISIYKYSSIIPKQKPVFDRKRTVTDAQLMHDKSRALQAFKRRLWLHELLQQVHTAVLHDIAVIRNPTASRPGPAPRLKPARVSKQTQPLAFPIDGAGAGTHVVSSPQETEKASGFRGQSAKGPGQRRKATTWYGKWSQKEKRRRHNAAV